MSKEIATKMKGKYYDTDIALKEYHNNMMNGGYTVRMQNITVSIPVSEGRLLYVFMADTPEEFERRFEQLANDLQIQIEKEMFKRLWKRGEIK